MRTLLLLLVLLPGILGASDREIAAVLIGEAGGEGYEGLRAVAAVMRNRTQVKGGKLEDQVLRPGAFASRRHLEHWLSRLAHHPHRDLVFRLVACLRENPEALDAPVNGADHFCVTGHRPYWARGLKPVARVGRHVFYRLW